MLVKVYFIPTAEGGRKTAPHPDDYRPTAFWSGQHHGCRVVGLSAGGLGKWYYASIKFLIEQAFVPEEFQLYEGSRKVAEVKKDAN